MRRNNTIRDRHRKTISAGHPPCSICGKPINYTLKYPDPEAYVVDHIIPLAAGGQDTLANKQPAHNKCNREKYDKQYAVKIIKRTKTLL